MPEEDDKSESYTLKQLHQARTKIARLEAVIAKLGDGEEPSTDREGRRALLETVVNASPAVAIVWKAGEEWSVVLATENIRQFGYFADDLISDRIDFDQLIHPDDFDRVKTEAESYRDDPDCNEFDQEYRVLTRDGQTLWVDDRTWLERDSNRKVTRIMTILLDITDRKNAESSLSDSESRYRTIWERSPVAICLTDHAGMYRYVNPAYCRVFGYEEEEMLGRHFSDLTVPDDNKDWAVADYLKAYRTGQQADRIVIEYVDRSGQQLWLETSIDFVVLGDGERYMCGMLANVTEQHQAEITSSVLGEIADATITTDNLEDLIGLIHRRLGSLMTVTNFTVALFNEDTGLYSFPYVADEHDSPQDHSPEQLRSGLIEHVRRTGTAMLADEETLRRLKDLAGVVMVGKPAKSWLGVPLKTAQGTIGVMITYDYTGECRYSDSTLKIMTGVSNQVARAVERKQTDEALRKSEKMFRTFAENLPAVVGVYDVLPDGRRDTVYLSKGVEDILDQETATYIGTDMDKYFECMHPEDVPALQRASDEVEASGGVLDHEYRVRLMSGGFRWIRVVAWPTTLDTGIVRWNGHVFSIHDQVLAREALAASEEQYRLLVENVGAAILLIDHEGILLFVNLTFARMYGVEPEEVIGKHLSDFFPPDVAKAQLLAHEQVRETESEMTVEPLIPVDGEIHWFRANLQPYRNARGDITATMVIAHDVTEHRAAEDALAESEGQYRLLVENVQAAISLFNRDGEFLYVNTVAARSMGREPKELVGRTQWDFFPKEVADRHVGVIQNVIDTASAFSSETKTPLLGSTRWFYNKVQPYRDATGQVTAAMVIAYDITERKEAEAALYESETRFRDLADMLPQIVYEADADGRLTYVNRQALQLTGYTEADFNSGLHVEDMFVPEDRERGMTAVKRLLDGEDLGGIEYALERKDGGIFSVRAYSSPVVCDGRAVGFRGVVVDISEEKRVEARNRAEFQLLSSLRVASDIDECLRLGCVAISEAGLFRRSVLTIHNAEREIIHLGHVGLDEAIVQAARNAPAPSEEIARQMTQEKYRISHSYFVPEESGLGLQDAGRAIKQDEDSDHSGGEWKSGDEFFIPIMDEDNQAVGWASADTPIDGQRPTEETARIVEGILDIVHQKVRQINSLEELVRSEEHFRTIAEATPIPVGITRRRDNTLIYVNDAMVESLGYERNELLGMPTSAVYTNVQDQERVLEILREEGTVDSHEVISQRHDGSSRIMLVSLRPIVFQGEPAIFGSALDITDFKRAEEQLLRAEQERYNQVKRIAGGVAHEIYNALFPAAGCLDKLTGRLELVDSEDLKRNRSLVEISVEAVQRAVAMTELVKDYSRLESERRTDRVDLSSVIGDVIASHQVRINGMDIQMRIDIPESFVLTGYGAHLHSLFNNLLINALDAMEESDRKEIRVTAETSNSHRVVKFADSGPGIPQEELARVFDAFYSTKPAAGTGLGLTMVQKIAELYGGTVSVESQTGQGTEFILSFSAIDND